MISETYKKLPKLLLIATAVSLTATAFAQGNATPSATRGAVLTLEQYLEQVAMKHDGIRSAKQVSQGANLVSSEGRLLLRPNLIGSASSFAVGQDNPLSESSSILSRSYSLGVSQLTDFGLSGKLTLNRNDLTIKALSPANYAPTWTQLELSQSLWRNWAGRETDAQVVAIEAGAKATSLNQSYLAKNLLLEAEAAYWRLALARETLATQRESVARAQALYEWAARRSRLELTDRAELLQTSTALQARKLDLRNAEDDERAAAQAFNSSRGINSNSVQESVALISHDLIDEMKVPKALQTRDDVLAAELQAKASAAQANLSKEKNKPTLEVYGSFPLSQPDAPVGALASVITPSSRPGTTVGIKLQAPLFFAASDDVRSGYALQAAAAESNYQRKRFEEFRDWSDIVAKFEQAKARLALNENLEKQQREKLLYERSRQARGRSTLQQVLLYEADYDNARWSRMRTVTELLNLNAQMKLYTGAPYESR